MNRAMTVLAGLASIQLAVATCDTNNGCLRAIVASEPGKTKGLEDCAKLLDFTTGSLKIGRSIQEASSYPEYASACSSWEEYVHNCICAGAVAATIAETDANALIASTEPIITSTITITHVVITDCGTGLESSTSEARSASIDCSATEIEAASSISTSSGTNDSATPGAGTSETKPASSTFKSLTLDIATSKADNSEIATSTKTSSETPTVKTSLGTTYSEATTLKATTSEANSSEVKSSGTTSSETASLATTFEATSLETTSFEVTSDATTSESTTSEASSEKATSESTSSETTTLETATSRSLSANTTSSETTTLETTSSAITTSRTITFEDTNSVTTPSETSYFEATISETTPSEATTSESSFFEINTSEAATSEATTADPTNSETTASETTTLGTTSSEITISISETSSFEMASSETATLESTSLETTTSEATSESANTESTSSEATTTLVATSSTSLGSSTTIPCSATPTFTAISEICLNSLPTQCSSLNRSPPLPYPADSYAAYGCRNAFIYGTRISPEIDACFSKINTRQFSGPEAYTCVVQSNALCKLVPGRCNADGTPVQPAAVNAVLNGGFEDGLEGWDVDTLSGPDSVMSSSISSERAYAGGKSLKIHFTNVNGGYRTWTQSVHLQPGALYTVSWQSWSSSSKARTSSTIHVLNGGSSMSETVLTLDGPERQWVEGRHEFVAGGSFANVMIFVSGNVGADENTIFLDELKIIPTV